MISLRRQRTLLRSVAVTGFGYWSGRDVRVEFRPAAPDTGVVFIREDLKPAIRIPAVIENRVESPRRTTLRVGRASVEMVEHILAALAGLQIDNCEVAVDAAEMPGCDGSSLAFVNAIDTAGVEEQFADRPALRVVDATRVADGEAWIEARPLPRGGAGNSSWSLRFRIDYGPRSSIGQQSCSLVVTPDSFRRELAPCRTFVLKEEADWLRSQGLALRPTTKDLLIFDEHGPVDNELRFSDECARHKALDLVGDLALCGCDLIGHFVAQCSGHRLNAEMTKALLLEAQQFGSRRLSA